MMIQAKKAQYSTFLDPFHGSSVAENTVQQKLMHIFTSVHGILRIANDKKTHTEQK